MIIDSFTNEYRFLSNFWPVEVFLEGVPYPSVEHAYQAAKTVIQSERMPFADPTLSASLAKRLGQKVTLRLDWDDERLPMMEYLLLQKFTHPKLKAKLIATSPALLIEGNYWGDIFWGRYRDVGSNHLGRLLMDIRQSFLI